MNAMRFDASGLPVWIIANKSRYFLCSCFAYLSFAFCVFTCFLVWIVLLVVQEEMWLHQLGSLNLSGESCVFVNLAGHAGGNIDVEYDMSKVNYLAPLAAAKAAQALNFGHWIQSSTQAVKSERSGQILYSRWNMMIDYALGELTLPVSIVKLGMLYSKSAGVIGQEGGALNIVDLVRLPLTPVMGDGTAPLQPQEVSDAAHRLAWLALSDSATRPIDINMMCKSKFTVSNSAKQGEGGLINVDQPPKIYHVQGDSAPPSADHGVCHHRPCLRVYDAVGPEIFTFLQLLRKFASYQRRGGYFQHYLCPVHIGYRNMERVLKVQTIGNINLQFISLLRSEQDGLVDSVVGDCTVWQELLGGEHKLMKLDEAFQFQENAAFKRRFPYISIIKWLLKKPKVFVPCISLGFEIVLAFMARGCCVENGKCADKNTRRNTRSDEEERPSGSL